MGMSWIEALKARAAKTGKYVIPKKGTDEYDAVKKLQGDGAAPMAKEDKAPKAPKAPKEPKADSAASSAASMMEKEAKKPRKPRAKKTHMMPDGTMMEGATHAAAMEARKPKAAVAEARKPKAAVAEARKPRKMRKNRMLDSGGVTERATEASSNPGAIFQSAVNAYVAPEMVAEITGEVKKPRVRAVRKAPPAVNAEKPMNAVPFSIDAVYKKLGYM